MTIGSRTYLLRLDSGHGLSLSMQLLLAFYREFRRFLASDPRIADLFFTFRYRGQGLASGSVAIEVAYVSRHTGIPRVTERALKRLDM